MFALQLLHGRKTMTEKMDDWGFNGPRLGGVSYFHVTYGLTMTAGFADKTAYEAAQVATGWDSWDEGDFCLEVPLADGCIKTKDGFFGDWEFQAETPTERRERLRGEELSRFRAWASAGPSAA